MTKSVSAKMGVKPGSRALLINAPADAVEAIDLPALGLADALNGVFDYIHLFVNSQTELHKHFPELKNHLAKTGMLWVSWPKAGKQGTDLKLTKVIEIGYEYGLVESKNLSVDSTWTALKFTHPKAGKIYTNSYGTLRQ